MTETKNEFDSLKENVEKLDKAEDKLALLIRFLEGSLAQAGSPHFKDFWEARKLCLDLFRQIENPVLRSQLWDKYSELSKEARRLKEILDEESAFHVEQIEMAISALEKELAALDIQHAPSFHFEPPTSTLAGHYPFYEPLQKELNLLNAYASRINALRKELIKLEMRIRQKNKFFQRLSAVGDLVFPRRKSLIDQVSEKFGSDVEDFLQAHFTEGSEESPFWLRDEIKGLQGAAKTLTLSTQVFKDTRLKLSQCWDKLKEMEKEMKKYRQEQKEVFKENAKNLSLKLKEQVERFQNKELSSHEIVSWFREFHFEMKKTDLGRDDVLSLREELKNADLLVQEQEKIEEEERGRYERAREQEKREKILNFKNKILSCLADAPVITLEEINERKNEILAEISSSTLNKGEKQDLEKEFKPLKDILVEKREKALLTLPENDRQALIQLKEVLEERKARRKEIKKEVDELRKRSGLSGFDIKKAMEESLRLSEENEKLEKINQGIKEIEQKIESLKNG